MGKRKFWPLPHRPKTRENIETNIGQNDDAVSLPISSPIHIPIPPLASWLNLVLHFLKMLDQPPMTPMTHVRWVIKYMCTIDYKKMQRSLSVSDVCCVRCKGQESKIIVAYRVYLTIRPKTFGTTLA